MIGNSQHEDTGDCLKWQSPCMEYGYEVNEICGHHDAPAIDVCVPLRLRGRQADGQERKCVGNFTDGMLL